MKLNICGRETDSKESDHSTLYILTDLDVDFFCSNINITIFTGNILSVKSSDVKALNKNIKVFFACILYNSPATTEILKF